MSNYWQLPANCQKLKMTFDQFRTIFELDGANVSASVWMNLLDWRWKKNEIIRIQCLLIDANHGNFFFFVLSKTTPSKCSIWILSLISKNSRPIEVDISFNRNENNLTTNWNRNQIDPYELNACHRLWFFDKIVEYSMLFLT